MDICLWCAILRDLPNRFILLLHSSFILFFVQGRKRKHFLSRKNKKTSIYSSFYTLKYSQGRVTVRSVLSNEWHSTVTSFLKDPALHQTCDSSCQAKIHRQFFLVMIDSNKEDPKKKLARLWVFTRFTFRRTVVKIYLWNVLLGVFSHYYPDRYLFLSLSLPLYAYVYPCACMCSGWKRQPPRQSLREIRGKNTKSTRYRRNA